MPVVIIELNQHPDIHYEIRFSDPYSRYRNVTSDTPIRVSVETAQALLDFIYIEILKVTTFTLAQTSEDVELNLPIGATLDLDLADEWPKFRAALSQYPTYRLAPHETALTRDESVQPSGLVNVHPIRADFNIVARHVVVAVNTHRLDLESLEAFVAAKLEGLSPDDIARVTFAIEYNGQEPLSPELVQYIYQHARDEKKPRIELYENAGKQNRFGGKGRKLDYARIRNGLLTHPGFRYHLKQRINHGIRTYVLLTDFDTSSFLTVSIDEPGCPKRMQVTSGQCGRNIIEIALAFEGVSASACVLPEEFPLTHPFSSYCRMASRGQVLLSEELGGKVYPAEPALIVAAPVLCGLDYAGNLFTPCQCYSGQDGTSEGLGLLWDIARRGYNSNLMTGRRQIGRSAIHVKLALAIKTPMSVHWSNGSKPEVWSGTRHVFDANANKLRQFVEHLSLDSAMAKSQGHQSRKRTGGTDFRKIQQLFLHCQQQSEKEWHEMGGVFSQTMLDRIEGAIAQYQRKFKSDTHYQILNALLKRERQNHLYAQALRQTCLGRCPEAHDHLPLFGLVLGLNVSVVTMNDHIPSIEHEELTQLGMARLIQGHGRLAHGDGDIQLGLNILHVTVGRQKRGHWIAVIRSRDNIFVFDPLGTDEATRHAQRIATALHEDVTPLQNDDINLGLCGFWVHHIGTTLADSQDPQAMLDTMIGQDNANVPKLVKQFHLSMAQLQAEDAQRAQAEVIALPHCHQPSVTHQEIAVGGADLSEEEEHHHSITH